MAVTSHNSSFSSPTFRTFERRDHLPLSSNYVWQIEEGIARSLTWSAQGHLITMGIWGQGDIVGGPLSRLDPYQIECLHPITASCLHLDQYLQWQDDILRHLWHSETLFKIVNQPCLLERLAQLLAWLAQRFGQTTSRGYLLAPILTHQEIAETLCTTRVTVTRMVARLEQEGRLIKSRRALIKLKDSDLSFTRRTIFLPY